MDTPRPIDGFFEVDGVRLHYLEWPGFRDHTVLLVHGSGGHAHLWDGVARALAPTRRVLAIDLRGHGQSAWPEPPAYAAEDYLADLDRFVGRMGLRNFALVGHSLGALLAARLAVAHGDRVAGLVWVDIEARPPAWQREILNAAGAKPARPIASLAEAVARERQSAPYAPAALLNEATAWGRRETPEGLVERFDRRSLAAFAQHDLMDLLPRIACPTLLVRGAESPVMRREAALAMAAALPNAKFVEIGRAQHFVFLDQPEQFSRVVDRFLSERVWSRAGAWRARRGA